jgi:LemA protein
MSTEKPKSEEGDFRLAASASLLALVLSPFAALSIFILPGLIADAHTPAEKIRDGCQAIALVTGLGGFLGSLICLVLHRNNLHRLGEVCAESEANLTSSISKRSALLVHLANLLSQHTGHEERIYDKVSSSPVSVSGLHGELLSGAEQQGRLIALARQYPQLTSNTSFQVTMEALQKLEESLDCSRANYNAAVRAYNDRRGSFPESLLSRVIGRPKLQYLN